MDTKLYFIFAIHSSSIAFLHTSYCVSKFHLGLRSLSLSLSSVQPKVISPSCLQFFNETKIWNMKIHLQWSHSIQFNDNVFPLTLSIWLIWRVIF